MCTARSAPSSCRCCPARRRRNDPRAPRRRRGSPARPSDHRDLEIGGGLADEVKAASGASPMSCYQCAKCSSGCPVADRGDLKPHELVRLVQTDQRGAVLASRFIWECTSCHTCITRCPQKVDIPAMNDALRAISLAEGAGCGGHGRPGVQRGVPEQRPQARAGVRARADGGLQAAQQAAVRRCRQGAQRCSPRASCRCVGLASRGRKDREELFRRAVAAAAAEQDGDS